MTTDTKTGKVISVIGTVGIIVASMLMCNKAKSQVSITGAFGVSSNPTVVGEAKIGYNLKDKFQFQSGIIRMGLQNGLYHGITAGPIIGRLIPFAGLYRFTIGNKTSQDRYVHNGTTEILSTNKRVNGWAMPLGVQYTKGYFYSSAGLITGDKTVLYITFGCTSLL